MNLRVIGVNHVSASIEVRERLAFSPAQVAAALRAWQERMSAFEAVLLSTCNRTEFYVASEVDELPSTETLLKFLLEQQGTANQELPLASQIFSLDGFDAVEHLFAVSASLDSMVLGEAQILSQVKAAYQLALDAESVGPLTHGMFQTALRTAKRVATETELHRRRVSIPSIAVVDFALRIFERLDDKRILVFGAGDMAAETVRYLIDHGGKSITVLNRNRERAEELAKTFNGKVADWDQRLPKLVDADVVVSTTGAPEPIVSRRDFKSIEPQRSGRSLFVLDLAIPRDFEPSIGDLPEVFLYSIDDLQEACARNRTERDRELPKAVQIVCAEAKEYLRGVNVRRTGETIQKLREDWMRIKEDELRRLFNKLPQLDEKSESEIRYAFERLVNKFLHPPLESLRDEAKDGVPQNLLEARHRLFRLK